MRASEVSTCATRAPSHRRCIPAKSHAPLARAGCPRTSADVRGRPPSVSGHVTRAAGTDLVTSQPLGVAAGEDQAFVGLSAGARDEEMFAEDARVEQRG